MIRFLVFETPSGRQWVFEDRYPSAPIDKAFRAAHPNLRLIGIWRIKERR
jgi:hypothetical protein